MYNGRFGSSGKRVAGETAGGGDEGAECVWRGWKKRRVYIESGVAGSSRWQPVILKILPHLGVLYFFPFSIILSRLICCFGLTNLRWKRNKVNSSKLLTRGTRQVPSAALPWGGCSGKTLASAISSLLTMVAGSSPRSRGTSHCVMRRPRMVRLNGLA
jgi:hypothetical protein